MAESQSKDILELMLETDLPTLQATLKRLGVPEGTSVTNIPKETQKAIVEELSKAKAPSTPFPSITGGDAQGTGPAASVRRSDPVQEQKPMGLMDRIDSALSGYQKGGAPLDNAPPQAPNASMWNDIEKSLGKAGSAVSDFLVPSAGAATAYPKETPPATAEKAPTPEEVAADPVKAASRMQNLLDILSGAGGKVQAAAGNLPSAEKVYGTFDKSLPDPRNLGLQLGTQAAGIIDAKGPIVPSIDKDYLRKSLAGPNAQGAPADGVATPFPGRQETGVVNAPLAKPEVTAGATTAPAATQGPLVIPEVGATGVALSGKLKEAVSNTLSHNKPQDPAAVAQAMPEAPPGRPGGEGTVAEALGFNAKEEGIDQDLQKGLADIAHKRGIISVINGLGALAAGFYGIHSGVDMTALMPGKAPQFDEEERALIERAKFRREQLVRDQEQTIRKAERGVDQGYKESQLKQEKQLAERRDATDRYIAEMRSRDENTRNTLDATWRVKDAAAANELRATSDVNQRIDKAAKLEADVRGHTLAGLTKLKDTADDEAKVGAINGVFMNLINTNPAHTDALIKLRDQMTDKSAWLNTQPTPELVEAELADLEGASGQPLYFNRDARAVLTAPARPAPGQPAAPAPQGIDRNSPEARARITSAVAEYARHGIVNPKTKAPITEQDVLNDGIKNGIYK